jgi:membrane protease YdiL (CAAX protease family)
LQYSKQFTFLAFVIAWFCWGVCILFGQLGATLENSAWLYVPYLLGALSPTIASYAVLKKNREVTGFKEWIKNVFRFKQPVRLYLFVIALNALYFIPQIIINGIENMNPLYLLLVLTPLMLFGGGLEEAGWRYILQPELDQRYEYLASSAFVAVIWSVWHLPLFFLAGTSQYASDFWAFTLNIIGLTFALGAIRKISGCVFLCVLYHCIHNAGSVTFNIPDTLFGNVITTVLLVAFSALAVTLDQRRTTGKA